MGQGRARSSKVEQGRARSGSNTNSTLHMKFASYLVRKINSDKKFHTSFPKFYKL